MYLSPQQILFKCVAHVHIVCKPLCFLFELPCIPYIVHICASHVRYSKYGLNVIFALLKGEVHMYLLSYYVAKMIL